MITDFAMDGKVSWFDRLPKAQFAAHESAFRTSFSVFVTTDDELYFLYYDNPNNVSEDINAEKVSRVNLDNHDGFVMVLAIIDNTGKIERQIVSDGMTERKMAIDLPSSIYLGPGEMLIHASDYVHDVARFGTLSLKE